MACYPWIDPYTKAPLDLSDFPRSRALARGDRSATGNPARLRARRFQQAAGGNVGRDAQDPVRPRRQTVKPLVKSRPAAIIAAARRHGGFPCAPSSRSFVALLRDNHGDAPNNSASIASTAAAASTGRRRPRSRFRPTANASRSCARRPTIRPRTTCGNTTSRRHATRSAARFEEARARRGAALRRRKSAPRARARRRPPRFRRLHLVAGW